uniref:Protein Y45F10D.1 putative n=1 Tax=Albugo laibachii Nc14 TaxID=890382 RepID=F0X1A0_9STRA|nr:protein Y45F10D.1 putative [Albugo laibachii Nc14]|eukprot:CCA27561.1 protein Y45F10D.1 putative [Albugo laibachii Nc14]
MKNYRRTRIFSMFFFNFSFLKALFKQELSWQKRKRTQKTTCKKNHRVQEATDEQTPHRARAQTQREIVRTYLQQVSRKQPKKRTGRPSKLKVRDVRRIFCPGTVSQPSSRKIAALLEEKANEDNPLHQTQKSPKLTTKHKQLRVEFAARHINKLDEFKLTIYADEKKFNLAGTDGCQYYWPDLRNEREKYSCNVAGGGSVMIWVGFSYHGKIEIAFLERRQNSAKYVKKLEQYLVPAIEESKRQNGRSLALFQQDNASVHSSGESMEFIKSLDTERLKWPAKSPDSNPIENVWGVLARSVYSNGRQFSTRAELKREIEKCWRELDQYAAKLSISKEETKVCLYFFVGSKCEKLTFLFQFLLFLHVVFCVLFLFCHESSCLNSAFKNEKLKKKIEKTGCVYNFSYDCISSRYNRTKSNVHSKILNNSVHVPGIHASPIGATFDCYGSLFARKAVYGILLSIILI